MVTIQLFTTFLGSTNNANNPNISTNGVWTLLGVPLGSSLLTGTIAGGHNPSITLDVLGSYSFRYSVSSPNGCTSTSNMTVTLNDTDVAISSNNLPCTITSNDPLTFGNSNITLNAQEEDWIPSQFIFNTVTASKGPNCTIQAQGSPNTFQFSNVNMTLLNASSKNVPTFGRLICIESFGVSNGIVGTSGTISFSLRRCDTGGTLPVSFNVLSTETEQQVYDKLFNTVNGVINSATNQTLANFATPLASHGGYMDKITIPGLGIFAAMFYKQRNNNPWFCYDTLNPISHSGKSSFITFPATSSGLVPAVNFLTQTNFSYRGFIDVSSDCGVVDIAIDIDIPAGAQANQLGFNFTGFLNGTQKGILLTQYMNFTPDSGTVFYKLLNATANCNVTPTYSWNPTGLPQSNQLSQSSILVCDKSGLYTVTVFCGNCTDTDSINTNL